MEQIISLCNMAVTNELKILHVQLYETHMAIFALKLSSRENLLSSILASKKLEIPPKV